MEQKPSKLQRIAAIIAIILLASLYLIALICAFINSDLAFGILKAALFSSIVIPVLLYVFLLIVKNAKRKSNEKNS